MPGIRSANHSFHDAEQGGTEGGLRTKGRVPRRFVTGAACGRRGEGRAVPEASVAPWGWGARKPPYSMGGRSRLRSTAVAMPATVPPLVYCQMAKSNCAWGSALSYSANQTGRSPSSARS